MLTLATGAAMILLAGLFVFAGRIVRARRDAEEALRESRQRFERAFTHAAIGMALVSPDGAFLDVNAALCRIVGYDRDELLARTFRDITHPGDLDADLDFVSRLLAGDVPAYQREKRYLHKSGSVVWILLSASLVRDRTGSPRYFVSQIEDITDRKEAEAEVQALQRTLEERVVLRTRQLAERERQLEELVGKLIGAQEEERRRVAYEVHDGPTQLVIATHHLLQAFADTHPPGATVEAGALDRPLQLARMAVKDARRIIEGLRPTALDDFGLAAALRLLVEDLREQGWDAAYEDTSSEGERLLPEVETALYRVAQEAITNVRKHAGTRKAHLAFTLEGGAARLTVRDWGRGFDTAGANDAAGHGRGERVGLSGMRQRIALLGGTLSVTSRPGLGTSLTARIPLPGQDSVETPHPQAEREEAGR